MTDRKDDEDSEARVLRSASVYGHSTSAMSVWNVFTASIWLG